MPILSWPVNGDPEERRVPVQVAGKCRSSTGRYMPITDSTPGPDVPAQSGDEGDGGGADGGEAGTDTDGSNYASGYTTPQPTPDDQVHAVGGGPGGGKNIHLFGAYVVMDPIDVTTADKTHVQVDYLSSGAAPLRLARAYHSNLSFYNARITVPIGTGWRLFYDRSIQSLTGSQVRLHRANGKTIDFTFNGSAWSSSNPAGLLSSISGGWSYLNERDVLETYDSNGRLTTLTSGGLITSVQYDGSGRLSRVINPFGRALSFGYDGVCRVSTVTLPDTSTLGYSYDGNNNLASIRFADNSTRQYVYENPSFPNALTGVIDESGKRKLTWTYDGQGRPNGGYYGNNVASLSIQYGNGTVTTTDARGTQRTRTIGTIAGAPAITAIQTSATADSAATGWTFQYDAVGHPAQINGRAGDVTTRQNDARGLPINVTFTTCSLNAGSMFRRSRRGFFSVMLVFVSGAKGPYRGVRLNWTTTRLARNLRQLRAHHELSQEWLAERAELHRTYMGSIEQRERNVSIENIEKLALALGVDIQDFLAEELHVE